MDDCHYILMMYLKSEAKHVHHIHDNVPLEVLESVIMLFSMYMVANYENK
jgi:hypothetical protein